MIQSRYTGVSIFAPITFTVVSAHAVEVGTLHDGAILSVIPFKQTNTVVCKPVPGGFQTHRIPVRKHVYVRAHCIIFKVRKQIGSVG